MESLSFVYRKPNGELSVRTLAGWREDGNYLTGIEPLSGSVRTFRKDRIGRYLDGSEALLLDPFPLPPPRLEKNRARDNRPQILFTGFSAPLRERLEQACEEAGLHVVNTVTQGLVFLCAGPNAGFAKVAKARSQKAYILHEPDLVQLLETGELPDRALDDLS